MADAWARLCHEPFDAVVADLGGSELSFLTVVRSAARAQPPVRVVYIIPSSASGTCAGGSAIREVEFAYVLRGTDALRVVQSVLAAMEQHRAFGSMSGMGGTGRVAWAEV
jgi:DNA-binding NarL/FixJ family response regulator